MRRETWRHIQAWVQIAERSLETQKRYINCAGEIWCIVSDTMMMVTWSLYLFICVGPRNFGTVYTQATLCGQGSWQPRDLGEILHTSTAEQVWRHICITSEGELTNCRFDGLNDRRGRGCGVAARRRRTQLDRDVCREHLRSYNKKPLALGACWYCAFKTRKTSRTVVSLCGRGHTCTNTDLNHSQHHTRDQNDNLNHLTQFLW